MPRAKSIKHEKLTAEQEVLITENLKLVYYCFDKLYYNEFKKRAEVELIMLSCMTDKERGIIPLKPRR